MRLSTKISNHPELAKLVEILPFPAFSVNLVVHRFQESRGHFQSFSALLWNLFYSWNKSCCALQMAHLLLAQDLSCLSPFSPGKLAKLMVFLKRHCNCWNMSGGKCSFSAGWFCNIYRQTDEQTDGLCGNIFVWFPFTVLGFGASFFWMS